MSRVITVKGIGKVSAKPDLVVLKMSLRAHEMEYERAMEQAAWQVNRLKECLEGIGFERDAVKTSNFDVDTDYASVEDSKGKYKRVFNGFVCKHRLKIEFDFDVVRLAQALSAVAGCTANPELSISFTVKDRNGINEELLRSAATNARSKAEILCEASGVKLGQLMKIDYNWGEISVFSRTRYDMEDSCIGMCADSSIDIEPEDIDVSDTATFVWEIA